MAVGSPLQKNYDHRKNRRVTNLRRRFNRSLYVQIVAVGVLTQYQACVIARCMLRRGIGSTGAEEVH